MEKAAAEPQKSGSRETLKSNDTELEQQQQQQQPVQHQVIRRNSADPVPAEERERRQNETAQARRNEDNRFTYNSLITPLGIQAAMGVLEKIKVRSPSKIILSPRVPSTSRKQQSGASQTPLAVEQH